MASGLGPLQRGRSPEVLLGNARGPDGGVVGEEFRDARRAHLTIRALPIGALGVLDVDPDSDSRVVLNAS